MQPVHSIKNHYRGINAHLQSYFQAEGGWSEFHTAHIQDIARLLRVQLLPMGYVAGIEESLQLRRIDDFDSEQQSIPESDITIFDPDVVRTAYPSSALSGTDAVAIPVMDLLNLTDSPVYRAIGIYEFDAHRRHRGTAVAWIELLSPSNKPGGRDTLDYVVKRQKLLQAGLVFVELDYLHESSPTVNMPDYKNRGEQQPQNNASAYRIIVIDPRPEFTKGKGYITQFGVNEAFPDVDILLSGDDILMLNCGNAYNKTYTEMIYGLEIVDYTQLPQHFDRYGNADQTEIVSVMLSVIDAVKSGKDPESDIDIQSITLNEGITRLAKLNDQ